MKLRKEIGNQIDNKREISNTRDKSNDKTRNKSKDISRNKSRDVSRDNRDKSMDLREKTKERLKYKNDLEEFSTTLQTIKPKELNNNQLDIFKTKSKIISDNNYQPTNNVVNVTPTVFNNNLIPSAKNVSVMVRFRPCNEKEVSVSSEMSVNFLDNHQIEFISTIENSKYNFSFDRIFSPKSSQSEIFDITARPILNSILEGFNGTILAYGQTASGKTFTMQGDLDVPELEGIIPRTISMLFESIVNSPEEVEFTVKTSMVEIYMEKIRDLIDVSRVNLSIREDKARGIYIEDISEYYVSSKEEIMELIRIGSENRIQASTNMNENSSRSHSIFIINVHQLNGKDGSAKNSKLVLVDLAGSEKISKTGATGLTLEEAKTINKSLTTLGMVINSLTDGKSSHIPYRESKLTRVLQESLGGNSKTCLIVTCSPSIYNEAESLSTLRFGNRAKNIRNKPKINKELTVAELQVTIDSLEKKLALANERIKLLERYIESKGLKLPKDNFSQGVSSFKELNDLEKTIKQADEALNINLDDLDEKMIKQDINVPIDNQIEKSTDYEFGDSTLISNYNKIPEDEKSHLLVDQRVRDELDKKMKIQELEEFSKQIEEERKLSSEQQKVITELREIIKDNDEFLNKIKENEKILNFNNEKIKSQIMEIKSGISLNYISATITNCKKENVQDSNKIIADLLKSRKVENINSKYQFEIEELRKELKKSENEKKFILKALEEKSEKIAQQEIEIKEFMEMVKILENKISPEDRNFAKKLIGLEKNLEQMNSMYQQIVTQKGVVKCENQILNKKIKQRNDRIILLEKEISDLKEALKQKDEKLTNIQRTTIKGNNVVKIIKGGHNKQNTLFASVQNNFNYQ